MKSLSLQKYFAPITVAVLAAALSPTLAAAQDSDSAPTFRVNVKLVNVYVNATDSKGAPVANLTRDQFQLKEDGVAQQIKVFEKESEQPLSIVLAVDTSGSVRKDWREELAAASRFLHTLVRPVDKVELLEFSTHVRQVVPFTNNMKSVDAGLKELREGYATALYEVVETAASNLRPFNGRKIIVVVSDGGNTAKGTTYDDAFRAAIGAEASIYSLIDVPVEASAGRELGGEHALITLAEDSGGKFYYGGDPQQLEASFRQLSDDLRTQYLLGYYPVKRPAAEDFRHISVSLEHSGTTTPILLRYRPGYFASQPVAP